MAKERFPMDEDWLPEDDDIDAYGSYDYDHDYWLEDATLGLDIEEDEEENKPFEGSFSWEDFLDKR